MATDARIQEAEVTVGARFPSDYRQFLLEEDGREFWTADGAAFVQLYSLEEVLSLFEVIESPDGQRATHEGLVFIGGDGGGEGLAFDLRQPEPPLVLVNYASAGWHEGCFQASTFTAFLARVERDGWSFEDGYRP